jgi:hypothetical protein
MQGQFITCVRSLKRPASSSAFGTPRSAGRSRSCGSPENSSSSPKSSKWDASWVAERLRLGKRPFLWVYRPSAWPAWNCRDRQVVRFWTAQQGTEEGVIDAFSQRDARALSVIEPTDQELAQQLRSELAVSRRFLRDVLDHYEDRPRRNRNSDYPTDEPLWRAAQGVREIEDALEPLNRD